MTLRTRTSPIALGLLASFAPSCAESPPFVEEEVACEERLAEPGAHTVLVEDTQLDPRSPALRDLVGGCYRIECDTTKPAPPPMPEGDEAARAWAIERARRAREEDACRIVPGVRVRRAEGGALAVADLEAWNRAIRSKRTPDGLADRFVAGRRIDEPAFDAEHGTRVASVIAHGARPGTRLVLLQGRIRSRTRARTCPTRASLEASSRLLTDPAVIDAYAQAAPDRVDEDRYALLRRHGVTLANESFGVSAVDLEGDCPGLPWRAYLAASGAFDDAVARARDARGLFKGIAVTTVRAAGNERATVSSAADAVDLCQGRRGSPPALGGRSAFVVIASYDPVTGRPSSFTNRGACVDALAPGERIVTEGFDGMLYPLDGTSLAAPMVTGLLARTTAAATAPADLRALVRQGRAEDDSSEASLGAEVVGRELLFDATDTPMR